LQPPQRSTSRERGELAGFLFHRDHGHVALTDFGILMRGHPEDICRRSEGVKAAARDFPTLARATLTRGVM
jgi:DNA-binding transcriptional LysR family regulator